MFSSSWWPFASQAESPKCAKKKGPEPTLVPEMRARIADDVARAQAARGVLADALLEHLWAQHRPRAPPPPPAPPLPLWIGMVVPQPAPPAPGRYLWVDVLKPKTPEPRPRVTFQFRRPRRPVVRQPSPTCRRVFRKCYGEQCKERQCKERQCKEQQCGEQKRAGTPRPVSPMTAAMLRIAGARPSRLTRTFRAPPTPPSPPATPLWRDVVDDDASVFHLSTSEEESECPCAPNVCPIRGVRTWSTNANRVISFMRSRLPTIPEEDSCDSSTVSDTPPCSTTSSPHTSYESDDESSSGSAGCVERGMTRVAPRCVERAQPAEKPAPFSMVAALAYARKRGFLREPPALDDSYSDSSEA
jgi:hypothetical protein